MYRMVVSIATALYLLTLSSGSEAAAARVKVGYLTISAIFGPIYVMHEAKFFAKNDLDVDLVFIQPGVLTQAMVAGDPQIGVAGPVEIEAALKGADFVVLGTLATAGLPYIITRKEITAVEQLRRKKFGISRLGVAPHRILELALTKLGIDPKEVTIIQAGGDVERVVAIRTGAIDGTIGAVEDAYTAKKMGFNVLVDLRDIGVEYLLNSFVTTRRFVRENEDSVRRFMQAMVEGIHYFKSRRKESLEIMAKYLKGYNREAIEFSYDWAKDAILQKPYVSIPGVKAVLDSIAMRIPKAKEAIPEQFIDSRFVKELDENGYIDSLYK